MVMIVLVLTLCVASLSGGLALLGHTELRIASAHMRAVQTAYAADAAAHLAIDAVSRLPDWALWPSAGTVPSLGSGARIMAIAAGEVVDLDARTVELNRDAARRWPLGMDTPRWRLVGWGRLPELPVSSLRVAVWVADDVMDADGIPSADLNGMLMIRGEAFGQGGAARAVVAHVKREAGRVTTVSWRED
jgi:hypothetical protein